MAYYFSRLMAAIQQEGCYNRLANFEQKTLQAMKALQMYVENAHSPNREMYKRNFMEQCSQNSCKDALANLISSMNGNPGMFGCDVPSILWSGDSRGDFLTGWRDQVTMKATYVHLLIVQGLIVSSASAQFANPGSWIIVRDQYGFELPKVSSRIYEFAQRALDEYQATSKTNVAKLLTANYGMANPQMS